MEGAHLKKGMGTQCRSPHPAFSISPHVAVGSVFLSSVSRSSKPRREPWEALVYIQLLRVWAARDLEQVSGVGDSWD